MGQSFSCIGVSLLGRCHLSFPHLFLGCQITLLAIWLSSYRRDSIHIHLYLHVHDRLVEKCGLSLVIMSCCENMIFFSLVFHWQDYPTAHNMFGFNSLSFYLFPFFPIYLKLYSNYEGILLEIILSHAPFHNSNKPRKCHPFSFLCVWKDLSLSILLIIKSESSTFNSLGIASATNLKTKNLCFNWK